MAPDSENGNVLVQQLLGRPAMTPPELLKELNKAEWPDLCYLHSLDFLALSQYFPVTRDDDGLYFMIAHTRVRPAGRETVLDLTDYAGPPLVKPWNELA